VSESQYFFSHQEDVADLHATGKAFAIFAGDPSLYLNKVLRQANLKYTGKETDQ